MNDRQQSKPSEKAKSQGNPQMQQQGGKPQRQQGGAGSPGQQQQGGETQADNPERARLPQQAQHLPGMEDVNEEAAEHQKKQK